MTSLHDAEVRRILDRYLVEVVERFDLCPWARSARINGEVAVEIVWEADDATAVIAAARRALAGPAARVAMVVVPRYSTDSIDLRELRDAVFAAIPTAGIAHFSPVADLDLATPPRLVRFLRRSPDPLLQLVPLALLDGLRGTPVAPTRTLQAQILSGQIAPPRGDIADRIAEVNHARVSADLEAVVAALDAIDADRAASYERLGISTSR